MSGIAPLDKPRRGALRNTLLTPDLPNIDGALFKVPTAGDCTRQRRPQRCAA